jgi:hypothetical protein
MTTHNIPLLRKIQTQILRDPKSHDQSSYRRIHADGSVTSCLGGWAIELAGEWEWVGRLDDDFGAVQVRHRVTGQYKYCDTLAQQLLGLTAPEAEYVFNRAHNRDARAWLDDVLAKHDTRLLDIYDAEIAVSDDDYPFGQVTA